MYSVPNDLEISVSLNSVITSNLTSVPVLVFILGFIAARFKGDLRLPEPVYQAISIFLLFGIGLKGGHSLKGVELSAFLLPALATVILGVVIPLLAFVLSGVGTKLSGLDKGAIAAHYGSTSLITFSAAIIFLENSGVPIEAFATALLTIMEVPGIIVGIFLGSRYTSSKVPWPETLREVISGKTIILLLGGMAIGYVTTDGGFEKVSPFFIDLQSGILALFLVHLGSLAGTNWGEIRKVGPAIFAFALIFPLLSGALGVAAGALAGLSVGGAAILGVLSASASYIAAPAAIHLGLPKANGSLALIASLGVTFPFNLVFGIPIYLEMAQLIA